MPALNHSSTSKRPAGRLAALAQAMYGSSSEDRQEETRAVSRPPAGKSGSLIAAAKAAYGQKGV